MERVVIVANSQKEKLVGTVNIETRLRKDSQ
jgi:hypothetical protein